MKRALLVTLLAAAACRPAPPPQLPPGSLLPRPTPSYCVAPNVHVGTVDGPPLVGATVAVSGLLATTNADGYHYFYPVPAGPTTLHLAADGFEEKDVPYTASSLVCDVAIALTPTFRPLPRLRVRGQFFEQETGARFTAIEASDFHLLGRFLAGEDIEPVLRQRAAAGFNLLRVWTRYQLANAGIGDSTFAMHPDLYAQLPAFLRRCAAHGLYVELTAYVGADNDFDPQHWTRLGAAVRGESNVLLELVNENDAHAAKIDSAAFAPIAGVLCSHGSNGSQAIPIQPFWDYATFHTNGAFEEQRKISHNAYELWNGPTITNETSRYPDVGLWAGAGLDRQRALAEDIGRSTALLPAGGCFHSAHGKSSQLWDANELAVATAWAAAARAVPLECQDGGYRHRDDLERGVYLRVYQRGGDDRCIARIRP